MLELEKLFHHLPRGVVVEAYNVETIGGGGQASAAGVITLHLAAFCGRVYSVYARWGKLHDVVEAIPLLPTLVIIHGSLGYVECALGLCIFLEGLSFDAYALWVKGVYGFQRVATPKITNLRGNGNTMGKLMQIKMHKMFFFQIFALSLQ